MKTSLLKFVFTFLFLGTLLNSSAQNWQYVGPANINNSAGFTTYLYFGDLELNAAGDVFVGYYNTTSGIPAVKFAMYSGSTWSLFPSPGAFTISAVDIEVQGTNYYFAYSKIRSNSLYYVYVTKYNGSSWSQLGDSMLLGSTLFDLTLDNAGVPTVLGVVNSPFADKKMMQYTGSAWTTIYTFPTSSSSIFREGSAVFNSINKLYCTHATVFPLTTKYFTVVSRIDVGLQTTIGDTIWRQLNTHKLKLDASEVPYLCVNGATGTKTYAFKLNSTLWNFVGDTVSTYPGSMLTADLTTAGKFVFNTQQTNLYRSPYYYNAANTRTNMDTFNVTNPSLLAVAELDIYGSSDDVYALTLEMRSNFAQDYSVRKHSAPGSIGINEINLFNENFVVYPNPSKGVFKINRKTPTGESQITVYNTIGELIYQGNFMGDQHAVDLSNQPKGIYIVKIYNGKNICANKIVLQ